MEDHDPHYFYRDVIINFYFSFSCNFMVAPYLYISQISYHTPKTLKSKHIFPIQSETDTYIFIVEKITFVQIRRTMHSYL